jgi:hypothetical protein
VPRVAVQAIASPFAPKMTSETMRSKLKPAAAQGLRAEASQLEDRQTGAKVGHSLAVECCIPRRRSNSSRFGNPSFALLRDVASSRQKAKLRSHISTTTYANPLPTFDVPKAQNSARHSVALAHFSPPCYQSALFSPDATRNEHWN